MPLTLTRAAVRSTGNVNAIGPRCSAANAPHSGLAEFGDASRTRAPTAMAEPLPLTEPLKQAEKTADARNRPLVVVGGGVSGVWAAITLRELGYTNVTILEKERRVGGKAASFAYAGQSYPLGAVGTPLALETASFSDAYGKGALRAARSLLGRAGRRLRVLNANNLVVGSAWPRPFPKAELTAQAPVADWKSAFGAKGAPERFYPHRLDFATGRSADLAARPLAKIVPRWGQPSTSWPLVYVSAHGYGVVEADDAPPLYYWARFAQKSTNAGAQG